MRYATRTFLTLCVAAGAALSLPAHAQFKVNAPFRNAAEAGWTITGNNNAGNNDSGILTGGYGTIADGNGTNDAAGSGWLRLTTDLGNQVGAARYTGGTFPSSQGVIVEFDYVSWGGDGADGLSFYLYDATQAMAGALAGAGLGYCNGAGGYLGIGLDEYGNFSGQLPAVTGGCSALSGSPGAPGADRVVVRGPMSANNAYIGGASVPGGIDVPGVTVRPAADRARIMLLPNGTGGYRVTVGVGQNGGAVANVLTNLNFPYAAPTNLRMGFGGSTGGLNNIHEVRGVTTSTPADIAVTKSAGAASYLRGRPMSYTVTVANADINTVDAGNQAPAINAANAADIVDTLPAQITGATWTCTATAGSTCPAASGSGSLGFAGGYTLAPGGVLTFVITGTVSTAATCGATVTNTATANFSATDGFSDINPNNDSASASFTVQCPTLVAQKISQGGVGTFGFSGSNGVQAHTVTTVAAETQVAGAAQTLTAAGVATVLTENDPSPLFELKGIACTGLGTGGSATVDIVARSVTLDGAATLTTGPIRCTFTNGPRSADVQVVKTASPDPVLSGNVVTYSLVVTNNGPAAVTDLLLTDTAGAGQDCASPGPTATCTATDGASCPSPTVPVSALLGSGIAIPSLPVGGRVTVALQCAVTASGLP